MYFVFLFVLASCATAPSFNTERPLESKGNFFTKSYSQDGKPVQVEEVYSKLKYNPATQGKAAAGQIWYYGTLVSAGVGGYFIGYNLFSKADSKTKTNGLLVGTAFIGASILGAYFADQNLSQAVETHNKSFSKGNKAARVTMYPSVDFAQNNGSAYPSLNLLVSY